MMANLSKEYFRFNESHVKLSRKLKTRVGCHFSIVNVTFVYPLNSDRGISVTRQKRKLHE